MKNYRVTTYLLFVFLCVVSLSSCNVAVSVKGNGKVVRNIISIDDYDEISLAGSATIDYSIAESPNLEYSLDENLIELVEIYVKNRILHITFKKGQICNPTTFHVKTSSSDLSKVILAGSGLITVNSPIESSDDFSASIAGSGNLHFPEQMIFDRIGISVAGSGKINFSDLKAENIKVKLAGSGDITLAGEATVAAYNIAGSGDIDAYELKTENTKLSLAGSGDLKVYATETLSTSVVGRGDVYVKGNPEISQSKVGIGKVHHEKE